MTERRIFDLFVPVDQPLQGELKDWPQQTQDNIYAFLEVKQIELKTRQLDVKRSYCRYNEDDNRRWIHLIVEEAPLAIELQQENKRE